MPDLILTQFVTSFLQGTATQGGGRGRAGSMPPLPAWCFLVVLNVLISCRHPADAFLLPAVQPARGLASQHYSSRDLKHSWPGLHVYLSQPACAPSGFAFPHGACPILLQAQASNSPPYPDEPPRALDLSAAAQGQTVEEVLKLAGVPPANVARALVSFAGLRKCDPHAETLRRLHHLNFIIEQGVYSFEEAMELISTQSRFLEMRFSFVHEDDDLLVMNKPSDVRMDVPQREGGERKWPTEFTCTDWLDTPGLVDPPLDKKRFCHNLDSATSGILCVARNQAAAARVVDLFAKRLVQKECTFPLFRK